MERLEETTRACFALRRRLRADGRFWLLDDVVDDKSTVIDPLRVTVGLKQGDDARVAALDEELWATYGVACELDGQGALTFAIPPLSPEAPMHLGAALIDVVDTLDTAIDARDTSTKMSTVRSAETVGPSAGKFTSRHSPQPSPTFSRPAP